MDDVEDIATIQYDPDFATIRAKYPAQISEIIKAIKTGNFALDDESVTIKTSNGNYSLSKDVLLVKYIAKDGMFVASQNDIVVSMDLTITEDIRNEGIAREVVRNIQDARKNCGLEIMDHIVIELLSGELPADWIRYICGETLASLGVADNQNCVEVTIDGTTPIKLKISKAKE